MLVRKQQKRISASMIDDLDIVVEEMTGIPCLSGMVQIAHCAGVAPHCMDDD